RRDRLAADARRAPGSAAEYRPSRGRGGGGGAGGDRGGPAEGRRPGPRRRKVRREPEFPGGGAEVPRGHSRSSLRLDAEEPGRAAAGEGLGKRRGSLFGAAARAGARAPQSGPGLAADPLGPGTVSPAGDHVVRQGGGIGARAVTRPRSRRARSLGVT